MLPPGTGNSLVKSSTSFLREIISLFSNSPLRASLKSLSLVPGTFLLMLLVISVTLSKNFMIWM